MASLAIMLATITGGAAIEAPASAQSGYHRGYDRGHGYRTQRYRSHARTHRRARYRAHKRIRHRAYRAHRARHYR